MGCLCADGLYHSILPAGLRSFLMRAGLLGRTGRGDQGGRQGARGNDGERGLGRTMGRGDMLYMCRVYVCVMPCTGPRQRLNHRSTTAYLVGSYGSMTSRSSSHADYRAPPTPVRPSQPRTSPAAGRPVHRKSRADRSVGVVNDVIAPDPRDG